MQLVQVAVFLAAAVIAAPLGRFLRMGAVLGYLAGGVLIGPYILGPLYELNNVEGILQFGEFGVVMLLFIIGLELRPVRLLAMRSAIFGLGTAQLAATSIVLAVLGFALGLTTRQALFVLAVNDVEASLRIAETVRQNFPMCRSMRGRETAPMCIAYWTSVPPSSSARRSSRRWN